MVSTSLLAVATAALCLLSSTAQAAGPLGLDNVDCQPMNVHVNTQSQNLRFVNVSDENINATYATQQILEYTTAMSNWTMEHLPSMTNRQPYNGSFDIAAEYCRPKRGAKTNSSLLLATHGIGFGKSYWDFPYKPEYSFVRQAASYGYSSFIYDRLGVGQSSTPANGGFSIVQAPTEEAILYQLITSLRNTTTVGNQRHANITLVGHSYGSVLSQAITKDYPSITNGAILTGFSTNSSYNINFYQAGTYTPARNVNDLPQLKGKPSNYLATASSVADVEQFLDPPHYDQAAAVISRANVQGVTLGELFSVASILGTASNFTGPVYVVDGNRDLPFCGRNCAGPPNKADAVKMLYPTARNFSSTLLPNTGHAVHPTSAQAYDDVLQFVISNGL